MPTQSQPRRAWVSPTLPPLIALTAAASSVGGGTPIRYNFSQCYSQWGLRCKVTGGATEVSVQLLGSIASSSDADSALVALTTWVLTGNSCDSAVFITGKPATAVLVSVTTLGLSSGANVLAWLTGAP